jgi:hypothetical protein
MTKSQEFRASMQELLELIASKEQQLAYQTNVPIADVAAELLCMWFDDMFHPDTDLFQSSFSQKEIEQLSSFNKSYDILAKKLPGTLEEYHKNKEWSQIMEQAHKTLANIQW